MATALNMTLKLKQDTATKAKLESLKTNFAAHVQPAIDKALRESRIVHFARVLVIDDKYIQVITEFDGDKRVYTDFFRKRLPEVFKAIFELADGVPDWEALEHPDEFFKVAQGANVRALGGDPADAKEGWLFEAYGGTPVTEILAKLGK